MILDRGAFALRFLADPCVVRICLGPRRRRSGGDTALPSSLPTDRLIPAPSALEGIELFAHEDSNRRFRHDLDFGFRQHPAHAVPVLRSFTVAGQVVQSGQRVRLPAAAYRKQATMSSCVTPG